MHAFPVNAPDTWVLQEKVVYTFQQSQLTRRLPHLKRQCHATTYEAVQAGQAPDLVLLSLWPQATEQQVLHYTTGYRTLYPNTKVVLLYNNGSKFKSNDSDYNATLGQLIDHRSTPPNKPSLMLHLFGTSGAAGACRLLRGYRSRTGGPLNVGAVVADTEPSPSITTFFTSSQQPVSSALFTFLLALWMTLQQYMWFWPPDFQSGQIHQDLNNPSLLPKEARKCFIFAQRGLMLTWMKHSIPRARLGDSCTSEVNEELHERKAYAIRRSSIDEKGRWSGDQERYWSGIEGVWEGR